MKTLYVAQLFPGSTALHRMWALQQLGCEVHAVDTTLPFGQMGEVSLWKKVACSIASRTNHLVDWARVDSTILRMSRQNDWDIVWVDKGQWIKPETLQTLKSTCPKAKLVNYSPDDMFNPKNQTDRWLAGLPIYDLYVTTKTYNVSELRQAGAKDALFVGNAFEPTVHKPCSLLAEEQKRWESDIVFVGAAEPERTQSISLLASRGFAMGLYGGGKTWREISKKYRNVRSEPGFIADATYAKALCASKIALGFLRKQNRDRQTTRSIEVPACGVFMLAERTDEHLDLFEEGKEAEFFSSDSEMLEKADYYLAHPVQRQAIAKAGRERCLKSGYSNADRLRIVLDHLIRKH